MKLLILDTIGMIGHVIALWMKEHGHEVLGYDEEASPCADGFIGSLYDMDKLRKVISVGKFDAVINCTAVINQDAEQDKAAAAFVNAYLPHFLEKITENTATVVVHRGTDCVFSGKRGAYTVDDTPDAESFYARTKAVGALRNEKDITIRTSLIGPETQADGSGLFNWFAMQRGEVKGYKNAIWTGITTIEFAREIEYLLKKHMHGLYQCVPSHSIKKYELLCLFQKYFAGERTVIPFENSLTDKSLLPNLEQTGLAVPDYEQMIQEMAVWIQNHPHLYPQYQLREAAI